MTDSATTKRRGAPAEAGDIGDRLLGQTIETLGLPAGLSKSQRRRRIAAVRATLAGLRPQSMLEGLMAVQMVATHAAAMACLKRAMADGVDAAESTLRRAERLLAVYARQTDSLIRARNAHRRDDARTGWRAGGLAFEPAPWMAMLTADAQAWVQARLTEAARADAPTPEPARIEAK